MGLEKANLNCDILNFEIKKEARTAILASKKITLAVKLIANNTAM